MGVGPHFDFGFGVGLGRVGFGRAGFGRLGATGPVLSSVTCPGCNVEIEIDSGLLAVGGAFLDTATAC